MINTRNKLGTPALILLMTSGNALAGGYIGAAYGKVNHDLPAFEEPNSIELLAGFSVNENIAVEVSYLDLGEASDNIPPDWKLSINGFTLGAVARYPVSSQVELQAKAGLFSWDAEITEDGFGTIAEDDDSDFFYGFGAMFKINEKMSLGIRYSFYEAIDEDFDILQAQLQIAIQ